MCDVPKPFLAFGFGMIDCTVCACLCMDSTMLRLYNYTHKWNECMNKEYWVRVHGWGQSLYKQCLLTYFLFQIPQLPFYRSLNQHPNLHSSTAFGRYSSLPSPSFSPSHKRTTSFWFFPYLRKIVWCLNTYRSGALKVASTTFSWDVIPLSVIHKCL